MRIGWRDEATGSLEKWLTLEGHCYYTTVKSEIQPPFRKSKVPLIYINLFAVTLNAY